MAEEIDELDYLSAALTTGASGAMAGGTVGGPWGAAVGGLAGIGAGLYSTRQTANLLEEETARQEELEAALAAVDTQAEFATAAGVKSRADRDYARSAIDVEQRSMGITGAQAADLRQKRETGIDTSAMTGLAEALGTSAYMDLSEKQRLVDQEVTQQELVNATLANQGDAFVELAGLATAYGMSTKDTGAVSSRDSTSGAPSAERIAEALAAEGAPEISSGGVSAPMQITPVIEAPPTLDQSLAAAAEAGQGIDSFKETDKGDYSGVNYMQDSFGGYSYQSPFTNETLPVTQAGNPAAYDAIRGKHIAQYQGQYGTGVTEEMLINAGLLLPRS